MGKLDGLKASYKFLVEAELRGGIFARSDLLAATGWKPGTDRTYLTKKWSRWVRPEGAQFCVSGIKDIAEAQYLKFMSQVSENQESAFEPSMDPTVEALVRKARQAAILAVDTYNRPATEFRTEAYLVLMVTAWTALLHAVFERDGVDYTYKNREGHPILIDGDTKAWELEKCANTKFASGSAELANLKFAIALRNKIEHRFVPALDVHVAGECQAMLFNFEALLCAEFGNSFALSASLAVPLQVSSYRPPEQRRALKEFQKQAYDELSEFLEGYRAEIDDAVYQDPKYSFRVYLVPKIGNHKETSDVCFEFVKYDLDDSETFREIQSKIVATRERKVPVSNQGRYRPGKVAELVSARLGKKISPHDHAQAWKAYNARQSGPARPDGCDTRFCQYDDAHDDYIYTDEWVEHLVSRFSDPEELRRVRGHGKG